MKVSSYSHLLHPHVKDFYPNLNSTEWRFGKYKKTLTFSGYIVSVIKFIRPSELKVNLNELFKQNFPKVQISLSKLRSLVAVMEDTSIEMNLQSILPLAKSYFEKLVFQSFVKKRNRRLFAAATFLLVSKVHGDLVTSSISLLVNALVHKFNIHKKDLIQIEFKVFLLLEFSLLF